MTSQKRLLKTFVAGLLTVLLAVPAMAEDVTAHEVVQGTTKQVMTVVQEAQAYVDEEPERYYQQLQTILDPVIDYRGFARAVMGPYATSERYRSLDEAGRAQLRGQLDRFTEVMRVGLVRTYGKGLLAFGSSRIEVTAPLLTNRGNRGFP